MTPADQKALEDSHRELMEMLGQTLAEHSIRGPEDERRIMFQRARAVLGRARKLQERET